MYYFRIRNVLSNRWLWCGWGVLLFLLFRTIWPHFVIAPIAPEYDMLTVISIPLSLSAVSPFAAVFCSLPVSSIFPIEYEEGFTKSVLLRTNKKKYIMGIIFETITVGSLAITIPYVILFCFAAMKAGPSCPETLSEYYRNTIWFDMALSHGGYLVLIGKSLLAALFGCVWSMLGLIASVIFLNRYIGAIAPFILYQTLWSVFTASKYNPVYLLNGNGTLWKSIGEIVAIQLAICVVLVVITDRLIRWRCRDV